MKISLSPEQHQQTEMTRREFAVLLEKFDTLRSDRDGLIRLRDDSRRSAAELLSAGKPDSDQDVQRLLVLERRESWSEARLESAQMSMNLSGEQVRDALLASVKPALQSVLAPALAALIEESTARLAPVVGEHQARAGAAESPAVRKMRNFLTMTFISATPAQGRDALDWLDSLLCGELPAPARPTE